MSRFRLRIGAAFLGLMVSAPSGLGRLAVAAETGGVAALQHRLQSLVAHPGWRRGQVGAVVQSLSTGEVVFSYHPDLPLKAASLTKLGTSLTALKRWGPTHTFPTEIYCRAPDSAGTVRGDLVVKGYGDPTMVQEQLWLLIRHLRQRGIERIAGDLVFDGSYLDPSPFPPGWRNVPNPKSYYAPLSAFSLNFNIVAVKVSPGAAPGLAAAISSDPESKYIQVTNRARTGSSGSRTSIAAYPGSADGTYKLVVAGTMPLGRREPEIRYFSVADPLRNYQAAFLWLLQQEGIEVTGELRSGPAPTGTPFLTFNGRSLAWTLRLMNKFSNNFIADQLLRLLGADAAGPPGTTESGAAVMRQTLIENGLDSTGFQVFDGSGLTYENRYSAAQMVALLSAAHSDFRIRTEFVGSLGINGYEGSIDNRMVSDQVIGLVRAKTGHLNGVTNIAGYVASRDGEEFAFAILANDYPAGVGTIHRLQDQMVASVAEFSRP